MTTTCVIPLDEMTFWREKTFQAADRAARIAGTAATYAAAQAELVDIWDRASRSLPPLTATAAIPLANARAYTTTVDRLRAVRAGAH